MTEQLANLETIAERAAELVIDHGAQAVMRGGQIGALMARTNDQGERAWTLETAGRSHGLNLLDTLASFALWHGAYTAWSMNAADVRQTELPSTEQLELGGVL